MSKRRELKAPLFWRPTAGGMGAMVRIRAAFQVCRLEAAALFQEDSTAPGPGETGGVLRGEAPMHGCEA